MIFGGANPSKEEWEVYKKMFVHKPTCVYAIQVRTIFKTKTLEGIMTGKAGDYLVKGTQGEFYPVDKKIFEDIYILKDDYVD